MKKGGRIINQYKKVSNNKTKNKQHIIGYSLINEENVRKFLEMILNDLNLFKVFD